MTRYVIETEFVVEARDAEAAEDILRDALDRNLELVEPVVKTTVGAAFEEGPT